MSDKDVRDLLDTEAEGILHLGGARMALLDVEAGFWSIRRQIDTLIGSHLTDSVFQQAGVNGGASFARNYAAKLDIDGATAFTTCVHIYQEAGFGRFEITTLDWPIGRIVIRAEHAFEAWMMIQNHQSSTAPSCAYTAGVLVGFVNVLAGRKDVVCVEKSCQAKGDAFCEFELLPAAQTQDQTVVAFSFDPGLGRHLNLLEILFERMPMGIAVLDREFRIQRYNPTWADFAIRYGPPSGVSLVPGISYFDHLPGTESTIMPMFECALRGETIRQNSVRLESEGIITFWDVVLAPLLENSEIVGILNVAVDATERVEARQNLEQRIEERTRHLQVLLNVTATANSSLDLNEMLTRTLDLLVELTGASRTGICLINEETGQLEEGILRPERTINPDEMAKMLQAGQSVIDSGEMMDIRPDKSKDLLEPGCLLPLQIRDRKLGFLTIIGLVGSQFSSSEITLFQSIADQLGVAIENAYLYRKAEVAAAAAERSRLARDLHDAVTQTLFSASMVADVLPMIWDNNPAEGRLHLEELRQLTRGALSEMRTLLVELRPAALVDMDLGDLVGHQVNAFNARTRVPVQYERNCRDNPPLVVKEMIYRVVQEAFNNIAKYAEAENVLVHLEVLEGKTELVIQDDGIGFDLESARNYGLGLSIMEERARQVGADFNMQSRIQNGTRLQVIWQGKYNREQGES